MMRDLAASKGGECVSKQYRGFHTKLKWRCSEGHEWEAKPAKVKNSTWCPICCGNPEYTIEDIRAMARERGGECLSEIYENKETKMRWRCSEGHEWEARSGSVRQGTWCPTCAIPIRAAKKRLDIDEMHDIARERGGECLSTTYVGTHSKLKWRCGEGHEWEAPPSRVKYGAWCPVCGLIRAGKTRRKYSIEIMKDIASKRGGDCLSEEYVNTDTKLRWRCSRAHEWEAPAYNVMVTGTWCPHCVGNARYTIDQMREIAVGRGGKCLSQKYVNSQTKIKWQCSEGHVWLAAPGNIVQGSWCPRCGDIRAGKKRRSTIEEMQILALDHWGECVSTEYVNSHTKLEWKCMHDHVFWATPTSVKGNHWCPTCSGQFKYSILDMRLIAYERGGDCLSERYVNNRTKLEWMCESGHTWWAVPLAVKRGTWCPTCARSL